MNNLNRLKNQFVELYALTRLQRGMRLLLRAFWMGIAGIIVGWGMNALFGLLPNPATWILLGMGFALVPVILVLISLYPVLFSLPPHREWVWKMDRQMGLREQLSTAWEVAAKEDAVKPPAQSQDSPVSELLVQDMLASLPRMRRAALREGWYRKADLVSSIILLMLACVIFATMLFRPAPSIQAQNPPDSAQLPEAPPERPGPGDEQLPGPSEPQGDPMGEQPGEQQPGEGSSEGSQPGGEQAGDNPAAGMSGDASESADTEALADALRDMGSELSEQAGTYELGRALENLDLEGSAQAMENLNEQLNELSPETRENMAQAMQDAAGAIEEAGEPEMSQNMGEAAEALPEAGDEANQALGDVAEDLRQMGDAMQSASGANSGAGQGQSNQTGSPEPLERLAEEGGSFDLPQESGPQSELLSPAPPDAPGEGTASGTLDSTGSQGQDAIQNPILPNSMLWKWRDVVSQYFQR